MTVAKEKWNAAASSRSKEDNEMPTETEEAREN